MIDRGGSAAKVGAVLKSSGQELIHHWNRLQREEIVRTTFNGHYRRLLNECYSLFVFVHHAGVSPTNNAAEQALRRSVIFRKLSFGTESQTGSSTVSNLLSVLETCRPLGRDALTYLLSAVQALFHHRPAPKLIPTG
jgi:hypothetical protein